MAFISKNLSWSTSTTTINSGTTDERSSEALLFIKQQLVSNGFSVILSSNGTSSGASDYWSVISDVNWNTSGNARSWIIIEHTIGYQICIDCLTSSSGNTAEISMSFSYSGSFSGGSTTSRPTASDEWSYLSSGWTLEFSGSRRVLFSYDSTNKFYCIAQSVSTSTKSGWMMFGVPEDYCSDWDEPFIFAMNNQNLNWSDIQVKFSCVNNSRVRELSVSNQYSSSLGNIFKDSGGVLNYYNDPYVAPIHLFDSNNPFYYGIIPDLYLDSGYASDNDYIDDGVNTNSWFLWGICWIPRQNGSSFLLDTGATPSNYDGEEVTTPSGVGMTVSTGQSNIRQGSYFNVSVSGGGGIVTS